MEFKEPQNKNAWDMGPESSLVWPICDWQNQNPTLLLETSVCFALDHEWLLVKKRNVYLNTNSPKRHLMMWKAIDISTLWSKKKKYSEF